MMFNLTFDNTDNIIPTDTVGIDMGQTLSKIAYLKGNNLILSSAIFLASSFVILGS